MSGWILVAYRRRMPWRSFAKETVGIKLAKTATASKTHPLELPDANLLLANALAWWARSPGEPFQAIQRQGPPGARVCTHSPSEAIGRMRL